MTKILIEVRGGNVIAVSASNDIKLVIIDYDNINYGNNPVVISEQLEADAIFEDGKAHELFADSNDTVDREVRDELKRIKF